MTANENLRYIRSTSRLWSEVPSTLLIVTSYDIISFIHLVTLLYVLTLTGPYGSPISLMTSAIGRTTANISWESPNQNLQNGVITYYTVMLADLMFGTPDRVFNTTLTDISFTELEEYTSYAFEVAAATIGLGPFSTPVKFTTAEDGKHMT